MENTMKVQKIAEGLLEEPQKTGYVEVYISRPLRELQETLLASAVLYLARADKAQKKRSAHKQHTQGGSARARKDCV